MQCINQYSQCSSGHFCAIFIAELRCEIQISLYTFVNHWHLSLMFIKRQILCDQIVYSCQLLHTKDLPNISSVFYILAPIRGQANFYRSIKSFIAKTNQLNWKIAQHTICSPLDAAHTHIHFK